MRAWTASLKAAFPRASVAWLCCFESYAPFRAGDVVLQGLNSLTQLNHTRTSIPSTLRVHLLPYSISVISCGSSSQQ